MKWIRSHWGAIVSVAGTAIVFLYPSLTAYADKHPHDLAAILIVALLKVAQEEKLIQKGS